MDDKWLAWALGILVVLVAVNTYNMQGLGEDVRELNSSISSLSDNLDNSRRSVGIARNASASVSAAVPVVAVSRSGEGTVGSLTIKVVPGNNNVLINTNPFLESSLQYSMNTAVAAAKQYTERGYDRDYIFNFEAGSSQLIGGESAGAAATIGIISALEGKDITGDAAITGTVRADGSIGRIGGVLEKTKAAADAGYDYFLIPEGQATLRYYERQVTEGDRDHGFNILNTRYVPKEIDLREEAQREWGIEVVEVSGVEEALPYFIEGY